MAGISATVSALLKQAVGNIRGDAERIRSSDTVDPKDVANSLNGLQTQIDGVVKAMGQKPSVEEIIVQDTDGSLIGWIGDRAVGTVSYIGAWFRKIWIGGHGPGDANIVADGTGVSINNATLTLIKNGVETDIANVSAFGFVSSLKSIDLAQGYTSIVHPQGIDVTDQFGNSVGYIRSGGNAGHISLSNPSANKSILLITNGGGSPSVTVTDGVTTASVSASRVDAPAYSVSGTPGVSTSLNIGTSVGVAFSSYTQGGFILLSTSGSAVFGTPGAGQSNGTVVTGATLSLITSNAVSFVGLNTTPHSWTGGLLTS